MTRIVIPGDPLIDGPTALRPWRDVDADAIVEACRDPDVVRWTSVPEGYGPSDARAFLLFRHDVASAGTRAPFAIVSSDDLGLVLGSVSLMRFSWEHRRGEVGYWLGPRARGQGHATRAVRLICGWGFRALRLERIDLFAATGNPASQRVAERSGFTREAVLRSYLRDKDRQEDFVAFGLLAEG